MHIASQSFLVCVAVYVAVCVSVYDAAHLEMSSFCVCDAFYCCDVYCIAFWKRNHCCAVCEVCVLCALQCVLRRVLLCASTNSPEWCVFSMCCSGCWYVRCTARRHQRQSRILKEIVFLNLHNALKSQRRFLPVFSTLANILFPNSWQLQNFKDYPLKNLFVTFPSEARGSSWSAPATPLQHTAKHGNTLQHSTAPECHPTSMLNYKDWKDIHFLLL